MTQVVVFQNKSFPIFSIAFINGTKAAREMGDIAALVSLSPRGSWNFTTGL
jgi:hypothetical protein